MRRAYIPFSFDSMRHSIRSFPARILKFRKGPTSNVVPNAASQNREISACQANCNWSVGRLDFLFHSSIRFKCSHAAKQRYEQSGVWSWSFRSTAAVTEPWKNVLFHERAVFADKIDAYEYLPTLLSSAGIENIAFEMRKTRCRAYLSPVY